MKNKSVVVFTRSGGIVRCFSICGDLYEYLGKERYIYFKIQNFSPFKQKVPVLIEDVTRYRFGIFLYENPGFCLKSGITFRKGTNQTVWLNHLNLFSIQII